MRGPGGRVLNNLKRDSILREAGDSLERLGLDSIDLYQIHWPIPDADIEEAWSAFAELQEQGVVRHIGVSNFSAGQLRRIQQIAPVETLQPPYSLVAREVEEELLPFAERERIGVIVYSPMGSGLLIGAMTRERIERLPEDDWRKNSEQEPQLSAQHDSGGGRGRMDAAQPSRGRRHRRFPPPRSGRLDHRGGKPGAQQGRHRNDRRAGVSWPSPPRQR